MTHDEVQDLLEDYVDERLDRATRRAVDQHLSGCDECRSVLDGVAPVELSGLGSAEWDERTMRRAVRRSMLRTAVNVAGLLFVGWLSLIIVSALVLQPVLVDRGGRSAAAVRATGDLALMLNPGASIEDFSFQDGLLERTAEVEVLFPVGTNITTLGTVATRITFTGFGSVDGGPVQAQLVRESGGTADLITQLGLLGEATVATLELVFPSPLSIDEAEALANTARDVRVVWAGFTVDAAAGIHTGPGFEPGGVVGYPTCDAAPIPANVSGTGSGSGSGIAFQLTPSVVRAQQLIQPAIENLVDHPELVEGLGRGWSRDDVETALAQIKDNPRVAVLVVTGPTTELEQFVADTQPGFGGVRGVDFFNWFNPICGR